MMPQSGHFSGIGNCGQGVLQDREDRRLDIFYRAGGPQDAPVVLLLHGFPTCSHMFRNLIPALADEPAISIIPSITDPLTSTAWRSFYATEE